MNFDNIGGAYRAIVQKKRHAKTLLHVVLFLLGEFYLKFLFRLNIFRLRLLPDSHYQLP